MYTAPELEAALANVEGWLGRALDDGDRERLQARRQAILAEQDERALIAASRAAHP
jgi:hypothetical protein